MMLYDGISCSFIHKPTDGGILKKTAVAKLLI